MCPFPAILDFPVPTSVELTLSNAPVDGFLNSFEATALPLLRGSLAYVATSRPLGLEPSETVPFRSVVDTFKVHDMPQRAPDRPDIWHRGVRVDERGASVRHFNALLHAHMHSPWSDYMIYGRTHLPSWRVDGLYTTRWSPTLVRVCLGPCLPSLDATRLTCPSPLVVAAAICLCLCPHPLLHSLSQPTLHSRQRRRPLCVPFHFPDLVLPLDDARPVQVPRQRPPPALGRPLLVRVVLFCRRRPLWRSLPLQLCAFLSIGRRRWCQRHRRQRFLHGTP